MKFKQTIESRSLAKSMHLHSLMFTFLGLLGVAMALYLHINFSNVSLAALIIFFVGYLLVGFGLVLGYHRLFTHNSFKAKSSVRAALGILGSMAGQGPILFWVALHRRHHQLSDKKGDPHSPHETASEEKGFIKGLYHSYFGWTFKHEVPSVNFYARDLLQDELISTINSKYMWWVLLGLFIPAVAGYAISGTAYGAIEGLIWGGLVRMFAHHNMIWWITSFAHVFGSRDYESKDMSTNNFWLSIITLGESWHNNHHAFQRAGVLNFASWQIDISGYLLLLLEKLGLVSDIVRPDSRALKAKSKHNKAKIKHPFYIDSRPSSASRNESVN